jgi:hypothetical protein
MSRPSNRWDGARPVAHLESMLSKAGRMPRTRLVKVAHGRASPDGAHLNR